MVRLKDKPAQPNDPKFNLGDTLVTEATFDRGTEIPDILAFIKREKLTGTFVADCNQGGVTRLRFRTNQEVDIV